MARTIWSLVISAAILYIAKAIGWISFGSALPELVSSAPWNSFLWLCIIAIVFAAVSYIGLELLSILMFMTCGLGCFALPVYFLAIGYFKLMAVSYLLPGFSHTDVWWQVFLLSALVGVAVPSTSSSQRLSTPVRKSQDED